MGRRTRAAIATGLVLTVLTWMTLQAQLLYKPLPVIDGYYRFLGLDERAEVVRDSFGIPRIEAGTLHDLFFLQGYVTAQDRFAQMDAMRVAASLSDLDIAQRPAPDPSVRTELSAYAAGVTKWIDQHVAARSLPVETTLSGRTPARWTMADTLRIIARYRHRPAERWRCFVVPGERAARGVPMLAAELDAADLPPGLYEVGLSGAGVRALGVSIPGVPGIVAGHNGRVAWSVPFADEIAPVAATRATSAADIDVGTAGCAADSAGGVTGPAVAGEGLDVEALRGHLGPAGRTDGGARIVVDLGDLDASRAALSTGQSGHSAAFHYRDQAQIWSAGQLHRLAWTPGAIARMEGRLVLRPR